MKNTKENRATFLLIQYAYDWRKIKSNKGGGVVFGPINIINNPEDYYFEGKPLSSITDEDAIEVAKIVTPEIFRRSGKIFVTRDSEEIQIRSKSNVYLTIIEFNESAVYAYSEGESYTHNPYMLDAIDFIRSRGYAFPLNGLPVQEQIKFGWTKLSPEPTKNR